MKERETEKIKNKYFLKIKKFKSKNAIAIKREFDYSFLKDYEKMMEGITKAIKNITKLDDLNVKFPIIILNHPEIKEIYIYNIEQWNLYYKYKLIDECIRVKSLKVEFLLIDIKEKDLVPKKSKIKSNFASIIKYIIKKLPLNFYLNTIIKFFRANKEYFKDYEKYLINEIMDNDNLMNENKEENNLEENININQIINNNEENNKTQNNENNELFAKSYLIRTKEFINALENSFNTFSENYKSFIKIKKILEEDEEKGKSHYETLLSKSETEHYTNFTLDLKNDGSLQNISLLQNLNDSIENLESNDVLQSVLNPPPKYIQNLMNQENFFKTFNKQEYYNGIQDYKDTLNRSYIEFLNKNN